jgi:hypothetical protein
LFQLKISAKYPGRLMGRKFCIVQAGRGVRLVS